MYQAFSLIGNKARAAFLSREKDNLKLAETKAWAKSSANAKTVQARMLCLAHNLITRMEKIICARCEVSSQAEFKHREQREAK